MSAMLSPDSKAPGFSLQRVGGAPLTLDGLHGQRTILVFHRFAGCPVCNLAVREYLKRYDELVEAGLQAVKVFHSPLADLERQMQAAAVPFPILADPERKAFDAYHVEKSWRGLVSGRFMQRAMRGMAAGLMGSPLRSGGINGMPASFLLDEHGVIRALHYGKHGGDSWSVDDALAIARNVFAGDAPRAAAHA